MNEKEIKLSVEKLAGKYLTFRLDEEFYGIDIMKAQEIIGILPVTRVPRAPDFIRGVINLRGKVIPVIDLRRRFGLGEQEDTKRTCIIVAQVAKADGSVVMGLIVDEVSEVLNIAAEEIEPPPEFGVDVDTTFLLGIGKSSSHVILLLDVDRVLSAEEVKQASQTAESGAEADAQDDLVDTKERIRRT